MFVLGLTGSIATGKSTVLGFFAELGVPTCSADTAVHDLYSGEAVAPVVKAFPGVVVEGIVDRGKLAARLVAQPERIGELEAIVHPLVREKMLAFLKTMKARGEALVVLEIPLLFETRNRYPLDAIAVTWCSEGEQRRRALERGGMSVEKFESMLARQMPQAEKKTRADFLVDTGKSLAETRADVAHIAETCRARASGKKS